MRFFNSEVYGTNEKLFMHLLERIYNLALKLANDEVQEAYDKSEDDLKEKIFDVSERIRSVLRQELRLDSIKIDVKKSEAPIPEEKAASSQALEANKTKSETDRQLIDIVSQLGPTKHSEFLHRIPIQFQLLESGKPANPIQRETIQTLKARYDCSESGVLSQTVAEASIAIRNYKKTFLSYTSVYADGPFIQFFDFIEEQLSMLSSITDYHDEHYQRISILRHMVNIILLEEFDLNVFGGGKEFKRALAFLSYTYFSSIRATVLELKSGRTALDHIKTILKESEVLEETGFCILANLMQQGTYGKGHHNLMTKSVFEAIYKQSGFQKMTTAQKNTFLNQLSIYQRENFRLGVVLFTEESNVEEVIKIDNYEKLSKSMEPSLKVNANEGNLEVAKPNKTHENLSITVTKYYELHSDQEIKLLQRDFVKSENSGIISGMKIYKDSKGASIPDQYLVAINVMKAFHRFKKVFELIKEVGSGLGTVGVFYLSGSAASITFLMFKRMLDSLKIVHYDLTNIMQDYIYRTQQNLEPNWSGRYSDIYPNFTKFNSRIITIERALLPLQSEITQWQITPQDKITKIANNLKKLGMQANYLAESLKSVGFACSDIQSKVKQQLNSADFDFIIKRLFEENEEIQSLQLPSSEKDALEYQSPSMQLLPQAESSSSQDVQYRGFTDLMLFSLPKSDSFKSSAQPELKGVLSATKKFEFEEDASMEKGKQKDEGECKTPQYGH